MEEKTKQKTAEEWMQVFEGSGVPIAVVNDVKDALNHPHCMFQIMFSFSVP